MTAREKSELAALWFLICWHVLPWVCLGLLIALVLK